MARTGQDRVLTVPNVLTVVRLGLLPVFVWLLLGRQDRYGAGLLLAALGVTDFADGFLARRLHQESRLGKVLDPAADRLLLGTAVVAIVVDGSVPLWVALPAAVREAAVGLGVLVLLAAGARDVVEVKLVGKAGTLTLMVALPLFLAANPDGGAPWHEVARPLAWAFALVGLVLSWVAAAAYVGPARAAFAGRRGTA